VRRLLSWNLAWTKSLKMVWQISSEGVVDSSSAYSVLSVSVASCIFFRIDG
jgi:hypothetical protein